MNDAVEARLRICEIPAERSMLHFSSEEGRASEKFGSVGSIQSYEKPPAADRVVLSVSDLGNKQLQQRLLQASKSIGKGQLFTVALNNHGLLSNFDNALLSVGEEAGALGSMHNLLSRRYENKYTRRSKIKSRIKPMRLFDPKWGILTCWIFIVPKRLSEGDIVLFKNL